MLKAAIKIRENILIKVSNFKSNAELSSRLLKLTSLYFFCFLCGCQSYQIEDRADYTELPDKWQGDYKSSPSVINWSTAVQSPKMLTILKQALIASPELKQKQFDLQIAEQSLYRAKMKYWPELSGRFSASRAKTRNVLGVESLGNQYNLSADLSYELNLWGQLSDAKRSAAYAYAAKKAELEKTQLSVVRKVSLAWFDIVQAQQLQALYIKRLANLEKNLNIIESGYRSGLGRALEVYLTRNDVEREKSRLIQQQQALADAQRALSVLLGNYPASDLWQQANFPQFSVMLTPDLPSEALLNKPELQASWLEVMKLNADLAVAHKARFPSLKLTASAGQRTSELEDLVGTDNHTWSIAASLLQPILAAGRLKAAENVARIQLQKAELRYTDNAYKAFRDLESSLQKQGTIEQQLIHTRQSADNALQAEKLAFEQYLKGLVSYTTVLDSQRRAVDAQIQLISLNKQVAVNKVLLFEALAGELDFIEHN